MVHDSHGLHHFHKRKISKQKKETQKVVARKQFLDKGIYAIGVLGPIMTLPQVFKIWVEKNATGVSLISWSAYLIIASIWLIYGVIHKEKPIIVNYGAWIVFHSSVIVGIILYGNAG
jgi:MtN3 and saliva related transmembrane protein